MKKKTFMIAISCLVISLIFASTAWATNISIRPSDQYTQLGYTSQWSVSVTDSSADSFDIEFDYGDGYKTKIYNSDGLEMFSHKFSSKDVYIQEVKVYDSATKQLLATRSSRTTVY